MYFLCLNKLNKSILFILKETKFHTVLGGPYPLSSFKQCSGDIYIYIYIYVCIITSLISLILKI